MGNRRTPEESRREILAGAAEALHDGALSDLTVGELMKHTRLGRSSFYVHFDDLEDLVAALLAELEDRLWEPAARWIEATAEHRDREQLHEAVTGVVQVWVEHGPVLRAITDAAMSDTRIHTLWREQLMERFIDGVTESISSLPATPHGDAPPRELATALLLMNERYLADRLGRPPYADPSDVAAALTAVWTSVIY